MSQLNTANHVRLEPDELSSRLGMWSNGSGPLYRQLGDAIARLIEAGELRDGHRLPPERTLARCLAVSRGTVVAAYDRLREAGQVARVQGQGTTVTVDLAAISRTPVRPRGERLFQAAPRSIDLLVAVPDPLPRVLDLISGVDLTTEPALLTSTEPAGIPPLRQAIADRMTRDGLPTSPEQILVTAGVQQAIGLVTQLLVKPGDVVLAESLTWPGLADSIRRLGGRVVGVPMDEHGVIVEELVAAIERFRPVLISLHPHHHNPTGTRLPPARREAVAAAAAAYCVPLVEDRVTAALAFDRKTPPPMAAHQPQAAGIVLDSVNKTAWAGLRIGWIRADSQSITELRSSRMLADLFSPIPSQLMTLAVLHDLDAIVSDRVTQLVTRAAILAEEVAQQLPDWELAPIQGGINGWARLPTGGASRFAHVAARHGVAIAGSREFSASTVIDDHVRLPFTLPEPILREAVRRLAAAWEQFQLAEVAGPPARSGIL